MARDAVNLAVAGVQGAAGGVAIKVVGRVPSAGNQKPATLGKDANPIMGDEPLDRGVMGLAGAGVQPAPGPAKSAISADPLSLGKMLGQHSAIEPGPLADNLAATFSGGRYQVIELQSDTVLFRAGTAQAPLGQFFSAEPPGGVLLTRIDQAVLPVWPGGGTSPLDTFFAVKIPAGTKVYVGTIGSQGGHYIGGTQQIVVPKPWTINGVEVMNSGPLK